MSRQSWHNYFMGIALAVATRGTCDRARVGALIVDSTDHTIIASGYNGSVGSKSSHCDDIGHIMRDGHCIATIHAEQNAINNCAKKGKVTNGASIYVTHYPCLNCAKSIISAGIKEVYFKNGYRIDAFAQHLFETNNIPVFEVDEFDKCVPYSNKEVVVDYKLESIAG